MMEANKTKGEYGENAAEGYLKTKGYKILARNYKKAGGEIDIIAADGEYIVFVEVKYRRGTSFVDVAEATSRAQTRRIISTAKKYLYEQDKWDAACRFDILEVFGREQLEINHLENAFWES
ncbi:MAG: YraN family protein [Clostridiales bacterium]|jgi:putative endonuclease|nr:YraN family protein [Clostridiales bacterium]